ncbi:MAG: hypothetical protein KBT35_02585 [Firmicutes bacterium]|nr:hypothetical protein [Candidatus Colivicinus equi]
MVNENKTFELKNEDLENTFGGGTYNTKSAVISNIEKNDSYSDGVFLYVVDTFNNRYGDIICDKYDIEDGNYFFMSSNNRLSANELLEMEYKGKFKG